MDKTLTCDCGFVAQARDDVELATEVRRHAWETHGMPLSHDEALLLLLHAELAGATAILEASGGGAKDSACSTQRRGGRGGFISDG